MRYRHYSFDFDSTLGKVTEGTISPYIEAFSNLTHQSQSTTLNQIESHTKTGYSIRRHLNAFTDQWSSSTEHQYEELLNVLNDSLKYGENGKGILYEDTMEVLNEIKKNGADISVVTFGGEDFQRAKLESSGILELVNEYRIVEKPFTKAFHLQAILESLYGDTFVDFENLTYVDDKISELTSFKNFHIPIELIRIVRNNKRTSVAPEVLAEQNFLTINTLLDLLK